MLMNMLKNFGLSDEEEYVLWQMYLDGELEEEEPWEECQDGYEEDFSEEELPF